MPTACVAREAELERLGAAIDAIAQGQGGVCLVSGQAGCGKSTIVRELASRYQTAELGFAFGRCSEQRGNDVSLLPWRDLLEDLTDLTVDDGASTGLATRARESIAELAPDLIELLVPGVGLVMRSAKLFGKNTSLGRRLSSALSKSRLQSQATVDADRSQLSDRYISILEELADTQPLVLVLEDLHWADPDSLALLKALVTRAQSQRVLVICTLRPGAVADELTRLWKEDGLGARGTEERGPLLALDLDASLQADRQAFARTYLAHRAPGLEDSFIEELVRHTRGIPLFVTRLVDHLESEGHIYAAQGRWNAAPHLDWTTLPADIEAVFREQLSVLDQSTLDMLAGASVEGETFTAEVVATLAGKTPLEVVRVLAREAAQLVVPSGTAMVGSNRVARYQFSHGLLRNYVFSQVDEMERLYLHEAVGSAIERLADDRAHEYASALAHHFDAAGEASRAWPYYETAAAQARATCSLELAAKHLNRAIELAAESSAADRSRLLAQSASLDLSFGGRLEHAESQIREAIRLAASAGGDSAVALQSRRKVLVNVLIEQNRLNEAQSLVADALDTAAPEEVADIELLRALRNLQNRLGQAEAALATQRRIVALAEAAADDLLAADLADLAWSLKETGHNEQAHQMFSRSLAMQHQDGEPDWALLATTHYALGDLLLNEERYDEARPAIEQAIEVWDRFDRKFSIGVALNALANLENRVGHFEQALASASRAEQITVGVVGARSLDAAFPLTCKGEALLGLGRFDEAIAALAEALDIRVAGNARTGNIAWTRWLLGRAYVESDLDAARGANLVSEARADLAGLGEVTRSEVGEIDVWLKQRKLS